MKTKTLESIKEQISSIRKAIENENVSYGEIAFLQAHVEYIPKDDILLLEWAGVEETFN
jgi:hypothetical protein